MRVVFDTDVMVAALRSAAGASRRCLLAALDGEVTMLVSTPLLLEYEAVLTRPGHLEAFGLAGSDVGALLDDVAASSHWISLDFLWRPLLGDADDEMVLETVVNGRADFLITFNVRHFMSVGATFQFSVVRPADVLRELGKSRA